MTNYEWLKTEEGKEYIKEANDYHWAICNICSFKDSIDDCYEDEMNCLKNALEWLSEEHKGEKEE